MKKWIIAIAIIIAAFIPASYIFIPNIISIKKSVTINDNLQALYRTISEDKNWSAWWPGKNNDSKLVLNENTYSIPDRTTSSVFVEVNNSSFSNRSSLTFIPEATDSVRLEWDTRIPTSYNPVKRLQIYFAAKGLQKDVDLILKTAKSYYSTTANIYGVDIRREQVKDSSLISTFDSSKGYPSTEKIYSLVDQLRTYIASQHAMATDSPMLNIYTKDSLVYLTRVAIPTDRKLPSSGKIEYRWMLGRGNILVADVKGEQSMVDKTLSIMENYVQDHRLAAPAIPFYSLTTNRMAEKDSTKWTTRIYYPVMYYYD